MLGYKEENFDVLTNDLHNLLILLQDVHDDVYNQLLNWYD